MSPASQLRIPVRAADHIRGPANAPFTLVEYGDYECPYCGAAYPVVEAVRRALASELRFVYRHFPLAAIHLHAESAAEAAEAAGAQRRFWEMHDELFQHQDALDDEDLVLYATSIGLDVRRFVSELASHVHLPKVQEDFTGGVRSGVNGTPTFFINGLRYDGPRDVASMLAAIRSVPAPSAVPRYVPGT